jgi:hypothetical protein
MPVPLPAELSWSIEPYRMTYGKVDGIKGPDQYGNIYGMGYRY